MKTIGVEKAKQFDDHDHVMEMMQFASMYGLEVECVVSAMRHCKNGCSVVDACHFALMDWDCYPAEFKDPITKEELYGKE